MPTPKTTATPVATREAVPLSLAGQTRLSVAQRHLINALVGRHHFNVIPGVGVAALGSLRGSRVVH